MFQQIAFYLISAVLIFSALMVVTQRSVFTGALYLAVALSMVGAIFVLLGADFLAAVQILLYVGGILVILAFAVMLSSVPQAQTTPQMNAQRFPACLVCAGVLILILVSLKRGDFVVRATEHRPTTEALGKLLLGDMVLPFEVVSLVLLASLVGAVFFSKRETP